MSAIADFLSVRTKNGTGWKHGRARPVERGRTVLWQRRRTMFERASETTTADAAVAGLMQAWSSHASSTSLCGTPPGIQHCPRRRSHRLGGVLWDRLHWARLRLGLAGFRRLARPGWPSWFARRLHFLSFGGFGSLPGGTVSESLILPSVPFVTTSPPPAFLTISRAIFCACFCVSTTALARSAFGAFTSHLSSGRC